MDPDRLTLLALSEPAEVDDAELTAHLEECLPCRVEVETLRRTVELARETVDYRDEEPRAPETVWSRISTELGLADADASAGLDPGAGRPERLPEQRIHHHDGDGPGDGRGSSGPAASGVGGSAAHSTGGNAAGRGRPARAGGADNRPATEVRAPADDPADSVVGIEAYAARSRRARWGLAVGALAAAVAVGVVGTLVAVRAWNDGAGTSAVATSTARLEPVAGGPGGVSGRAVVREGEDGRELDVSAAGLPLQQGYYEVWVFDGGRNMVSLGVLGPDSTAALSLPPTLALQTYPVIDISEERYDGDQTHSQVSVLRGTLTG